MVVETYSVFNAAGKASLIGLQHGGYTVEIYCDPSAVAIAYMIERYHMQSKDLIHVFYIEKYATVKRKIKKVQFFNGTAFLTAEYFGVTYAELEERVEKAFIDYAQYLVEARLGLHDNKPDH